MEPCAKKVACELHEEVDAADRERDSSESGLEKSEPVDHVNPSVSEARPMCHRKK